MPTVYIGNWQNSGGNTNGCSTWPGFGEIPPDYGQNLENPPLKTRDLHDHFRADDGAESNYHYRRYPELRYVTTAFGQSS